jgi:DNA-binding helix-hairpin-helix protein with protein kinase domain
MSVLKNGETLGYGAGQKITVVREIGQGGQGAVYEVQDDTGTLFALKWYHTPAADERAQRGYEEQRVALRDSIGNGGPALPALPPPNGRFLWPLAYVEKKGVSGPHGAYDGYGYLMNLLPSGYVSLEDLALGRVPFGPAGPYRALCRAAVGLADCFRVLHLKGLCYKDINDGGAFLNPLTGDVLVCDNDNVRYDGTKGIIFKPEFAAPEVNLGAANCSTATDQHSLAVLLFYMFCRGNPLEGKREVNTYVFEDAAKRRTFGSDPIFIFDPRNDANRPVAGVQDGLIKNWKRLPKALRGHFERVFTAGLTSPQQRLTDTQWLNAFSTARDSLFPCNHCGREIFFDPETPGQQVDCGLCGKPNARPAVLVLDQQQRVVLGSTAVLFPHHLAKVGAYGLYDFSRVVAKVVQNPKNPAVWGLRNESQHTWTSTSNDGTPQDVPPGKSWVLRQGQKVDLGGVVAEVIPG